MSKKEEYSLLVQEVKECAACASYPAKQKQKDGTVKTVALVNDSNRSHINQWAAWQGSLDADVLVIGQDFGELNDRKFRNSEKLIANGVLYTKSWNDTKSGGKNPTDNNLIKYFREAYNIDADKPNKRLFFTNSVFCYKEGLLTNAVNNNWFKICNQRYMGCLIQIIRPEVVITLGSKALHGLRCSGGLLTSLDEKPLRNSYFSRLSRVVDSGAILISYTKIDPIYVCPVFHTGSFGDMTRRKLGGNPLEDWKRYRQYIN